MTRAVGMFGSDAAVDKLHTTLRNVRVHLERHNFRHPDDILNRLKDEPEIAAVLLVEKALKAHDPNVYAALETLRSADRSIRIIYIRDALERDYPFELWCYEHGIYDIIYPSRQTDVNIDAIRDAVLLGRIDPDNPPPPTDEHTPQVTEDKPGLLDRFKGFNMPEIKLPEWKLPSFSEFLRRNRQERVESESTPQSEPSAVPQTPPSAPAAPAIKTAPPRIIGVINCSRGFGATSLVVSMAAELSRTGKTVAVAGMDFSPDLNFTGLPERGVTVIVPSGDELPKWEALITEHDFTLIDFGAIFEFLPSGGVTPAQSSAGMARAVQEAMNLCDLRIYLASTEPWHRRKAKAFASDEKGFVIHRQEADASVILTNLGVV